MNARMLGLPGGTSARIALRWTLAAVIALTVLNGMRLAGIGEENAAANGESMATYRDRLGSVWTETEGPWTGTWTRQGDSNYFSAVWTAPGYAPRVGQLYITINDQGTVVAKYLPGGPADRYYCDYEGFVAPGTVTVGGTRSCLGLEDRHFTATIR